MALAGQLRRSLLEEVKTGMLTEESKAQMVSRWKTSTVSELDLIESDVPAGYVASLRTL